MSPATYRPFAHSAPVSVPNLVTYNLCGLAANEQRYDKRRRYKSENVTSLTTSFGVTCLQETHLKKKHCYFRTGFPSSRHVTTTGLACSTLMYTYIIPLRK